MNQKTTTFRCTYKGIHQIGNSNSNLRTDVSIHFWQHTNIAVEKWASVGPKTRLRSSYAAYTESRSLYLKFKNKIRNKRSHGSSFLNHRLSAIQPNRLRRKTCVRTTNQYRGPTSVIRLQAYVVKNMGRGRLKILLNHIKKAEDLPLYRSIILKPLKQKSNISIMPILSILIFFSTVTI